MSAVEITNCLGCGDDIELEQWQVEARDFGHELEPWEEDRLYYCDSCIEAGINHEEARCCECGAPLTDANRTEFAACQTCCEKDR